MNRTEKQKYLHAASTYSKSNYTGYDKGHIGWDNTCRWSATFCSYHEVDMDIPHQCWHSCPCKQKLTRNHNDQMATSRNCSKIQY